MLIDYLDVIDLDAEKDEKFAGNEYLMQREQKREGRISYSYWTNATML